MVFVRQYARDNNQAQKLPGVTDTIAAGLSEVLARPWFMLLPMLLDLYYWLGWRFLPTAVTNRVAKSIQDSSLDDKKSWLDFVTDVEKVDLAGIVGQFVPSVLVGANRDQVYEVWSR